MGGNYYGWGYEMKERIKMKRWTKEREDKMETKKKCVRDAGFE